MHEALKNNPEFAKIQAEVMGDTYTVEPAKPPEGAVENIIQENEKAPPEVDNPPAEETAEETDKPQGYEGFKTLDQFVEDGGDPEFYRGKEAYKQQKDLIKEKKESENKYKTRIDAMEKQLIDLVYSNDQQKNAAIADAKADIEIAKKNDDTEGVAEAYQKLQEMEKPKSASPDKPVAFPCVQEFIKNENRLDPLSPNYDRNYDVQFDALVKNSSYNAQIRIGGRALTDPEMQSHLDYAHSILNPQQSRHVEGQQTTLNSNRNKAAKVGAPRGSKSKVDPFSKMDTDTKQLYDRWNKSRNPDHKEMAKSLKRRYED